MSSGVHADRVPVKSGDRLVGQARIYEDGSAELMLNMYGKEIFHYIREGLVVGLNLIPIVEPAIGATLVTRIDRERK